MLLTIRAVRDRAEPIREGGVLVLTAEVKWAVEADEGRLDRIASALPSGVVERVAASVLTLHFVNAVGRFDVPYLGCVEVRSGKWTGAHFHAMLGEITRSVAALPFAAGEGPKLAYDRTMAEDESVLYHTFLYLAHILGEEAPRDERLAPALRWVVAHPHRRFERETECVPLERTSRVEARAIERMLGGGTTFSRTCVAVGSPISRALGGYLPNEVEQGRLVSTLDVPENRFVAAFLAQIEAIVERVREAAAARASQNSAHASFRARVESEAVAIERALAPISRHPMWQAVSRMDRFPAESTVLQRGRGYRDVLRHFTRLRMSTRLPMDPETVRRMIEIKDIAELYELWSFFRVLEAVEAVLGPPAVATRPARNDFTVHLPYDLEVRWSNGVSLSYNRRFRRSAGAARLRSFSVPLRPDIALWVPEEGASSARQGTFHLFDAKFRVRRVADAGIEDGVAAANGNVGEGPSADVGEARVAPGSEGESPASAVVEERERRGDFIRGDLYKMHTYRDAIRAARSVWILYPGGDFRFYAEDPSRSVLRSVTDVEAASHAEWSAGVGAIPLRPSTGGGDPSGKAVARGYDEALLGSVIGRCTRTLA